MRILLSGDSHCDVNHLGSIVAKKAKFDCDKVFVLGDFGWWPKDKSGRKFIEACGDLDFPIYFLAGNHECVSADTRCLTKRGFLHYEDLNLDDEVLSVDDEGFAFWQPINEIIINDFDGEMIRVKSRSLDMLLTPKHRVISKKRKSGKWDEFSAEDWKNFNERDIIVSGKNPLPDYDIDESLIRLYAWCLTDGHATSGTWTIYQRKSNLHKITSLCESLGLDYSVSEREREVEEICGKPCKSNEPQCDLRIKTASGKLLPWPNSKNELAEWLWNLSEKQFDIFIDSFVDGDGSWATQGVNSGVLYCNLLSLRENMLRLMTANGYRVSISEPILNDFRINFCKSTTVSFILNNIEKNQTPKLSSEYYIGKVWCLRVDNKRFFVERNGSIYLTGNCWEDLEKHEKYPDYNDDGFIVVAPNVFYAPTGFRWEWDGVKFLSVGGAYSIDRKYRVKFISWFPQEIITQEDMKKIQVTDISLERNIDVILSHDAPAGVDMAMEFATTYGEFKTFDLDSGTETNMQRLRWACDWWKPSNLYHGHWHLRYTQEHEFYDNFSRESYDITITGLNCNQTGGEAFHVLDTKDIK